jgi:exopolyphosphatase / guanosine-5'-triphosphate,3'-diphosphate pyrophosphatase
MSVTAPIIAFCAAASLADGEESEPDSEEAGALTRVAAVDCGTNSLRLLVADLPDPRVPGQPLTDVVRRMEIVRLGQGVDRTGRLDPAAIERTRVVLAEYAAQIADLGASQVRMVATSATRDAANAADFLTMVTRTLGKQPEVITGGEEARLSFTGAVKGLPATLRAPYLVVDIGGGSTEFVLGGTHVHEAISVDIGCVRMTERHLRGDPPTPEQVEAARTDIAAAAGPAIAAVGGSAARTLIGLAGSVTTVAAIALGLDEYRPERIHHAEISAREVASVCADLLRMTHAQRSALPVMHPGRVDVIGAGALILTTIMALLGASRVVASEHDILDGIAWSLAPV